jgi:pyruvate formate lyase activating enzyme
MIFNIQRFSTHDGDGIRTIIFYKGCPLSCKWCCNPESQSFEPTLLYDRKLCKNFGDCIKIGNGSLTSGKTGVEIDRSSIQKPELFRNVCLSKALVVSGEEKSAGQLLAEIEKDIPFYNNSRGGVTLSGGEPLSHGPELVTLLKELRNRSINVAIETSLHVPWVNIERCINFADSFLVDLKHTKKEKFNSFAGGDAELVLENLRKLASHHNNIIVRVPVVPGFNHTEMEISEIIDFTVSLRTISEIHFLPFHNLGEGKYEMAGMEYLYEGARQVDIKELEGYVDYAKSAGLKVRIGG